MITLWKEKLDSKEKYAKAVTEIKNVGIYNEYIQFYGSGKNLKRNHNQWLYNNHESFIYSN